VSLPAQIVDLEEMVLPSNARLLYHDNECFDWGTLGWIMQAGIVDIQDYKYFVMVNSNVRGPYAQPYQIVRFPLPLRC
jgi:translation initiation factor eIF-2B subunit epsilon